MEPSTTEQRRKSGILKHPEGEDTHTTSEHIKWDEEVIKEHDKDRGTRQTIPDPKTPYHGDGDVEMADDEHIKAGSIPSNEKVIMEEVKDHLKEAEKNKQINAHLGEVDHAAVLEKVAHQLENPYDKEDARHKEFEEKRKMHYKGEANAAMLLKQKFVEEDDDS